MASDKSGFTLGRQYISRLQQRVTGGYGQGLDNSDQRCPAATASVVPPSEGHNSLGMWHPPPKIFPVSSKEGLFEPHQRDLRRLTGASWQCERAVFTEALHFVPVTNQVAFRPHCSACLDHAHGLGTSLPLAAWKRFLAIISTVEALFPRPDTGVDGALRSADHENTMARL